MRHTNRLLLVYLAAALCSGCKLQPIESDPARLSDDTISKRILGTWYWEEVVFAGNTRGHKPTRFHYDPDGTFYYEFGVLSEDDKLVYQRHPGTWKVSGDKIIQTWGDFLKEPTTGQIKSITLRKMVIVSHINSWDEYFRSPRTFTIPEE